MRPNKRRKRNAMRNVRNITRHQYANIAIKSTHWKRRTNAANWRQTKLLTQITGNPLKGSTRTHLTWFCCLNEFSSPNFGYCTDSYVLIQNVSKIYVRLIRSTYVLYNNKYLHTYFMTIPPHRNCTSSYESDKIVRFSALVGILEIYKKFNKSVKNYI